MFKDVQDLPPSCFLRCWFWETTWCRISLWGQVRQSLKTVDLLRRCACPFLPTLAQVPICCWLFTRLGSWGWGWSRRWLDHRLFFENLSWRSWGLFVQSCLTWCWAGFKTSQHIHFPTMEISKQVHVPSLSTFATRQAIWLHRSRFAHWQRYRLFGIGWKLENVGYHRGFCGIFMINGDLYQVLTGNTLWQLNA